MEKRLKEYLAYYKKASEEGVNPSEKEAFLKEMLIQIGFFQHERLIHLIVTVLFAILTVLAILAVVFAPQLSLLLLTVMLLVLLVPYIRHYYILENGVQKLYTYYDIIRSDEKV